MHFKNTFNSKPLMTAGNIYKIYSSEIKFSTLKYNILSYFRRKWYMKDTDIKFRKLLQN